LAAPQQEAANKFVGAKYGAPFNRPSEAFAYANAVVEHDLAPVIRTVSVTPAAPVLNDEEIGEAWEHETSSSFPSKGASELWLDHIDILRFARAILATRTTPNT